ncbi:MAG: tRNA lysidine(34) synthetase TilS [Bacteroidetes bacterium]|nr:tRNA lysidine(34) synthetase TilS [Bacteroidota bacterium]
MDSTRLISRVSQTIKSNDLLNQGDCVIVAVSGGSDSLALLDILMHLDLKLHLVAAYINHGLRPEEISKEIRLLEQYCSKRNISFKTDTVPVIDFANEEKKSIEEAARILRYEALQKISYKHAAKAIVTGHTADDQVEHFLIRIIRGASPSGLTGMQLKRENIIRPLLFEKKQTLTSYLKDKSISWCTDSSNADRKFLRNRVRHDLLPIFRSKFNPSIDRSILQCMQTLSAEDKYIKQISNTVFKFSVTINKNNSLLVHGDHLLKEHLAIQRRIVEKCCWFVGTRPSYNQLESIIKLLKNPKNSGELHLENNILVEKVEHDIRFSKTSVPHRKKSHPQPELNIEVPGPGIYKCQKLRKKLRIKKTCTTLHFIPTKQYLDMARVTFPLKVRSLLPGDRFHPYNSPGHKKVSRYFNDKKIPVKQRQNYPLLVDEINGIIAVLGLQIDNNYKISKSTTRLLEISWDDDNSVEGDAGSV